MLAEERNRVIVGMGATGLSCARYFSAMNLSFSVVDSRKEPPYIERFLEEFPTASIVCGEFKKESFAGNDLLVVSPGVSMKEPAIASALRSGADFTSDIEIFLEDNKAPVVAITGSNGKSTVTMLVAHILKQCGVNVCVAGNIGNPVLSELLTGQEYDVVVLELSSFQLERLAAVNAYVATILNVTEDHMDRYDGSMSEYQAAKLTIYNGSQYIVCNQNDYLTYPSDKELHKVINFSVNNTRLSENVRSYWLKNIDDQSFICFENDILLDVSALKIKGSHNIANVMAALAIVSFFECNINDVISAVKSFAGLRHRCEWVDTINGISFYNDSKATNVGAAVASIRGLSNSHDKNAGRLFLIAGGQDKKSDFSSLIDAIKRHVEHVYLIGVDAVNIERWLPNNGCSERSLNLADAVEKAFSHAVEGDTILLAPACASFDMFSSFEDRGDQFVEAVRAL